MAAERSMVLSAVCIWENLTEEDISAVSAAGGQRILHLPLDGNSLYMERLAIDCLAETARREEPAFILFESSVFASAVAPALSACLGCGITADCTAVAWSEEGEKLQQFRPTVGGRRLAVIENREAPVIATVCKGVFAVSASLARREAEVVRLDVPLGNDVWSLKAQLQSACKSKGPSGANIVFSGGLGMGNRDSFQKLFRLADKVNAGVGASRAAVAAGFTSYDHQIGQTGMTVRPQLYVAFGISGAVQHLSGMICSEFICAVNQDPKAPIHAYSDYSIITDCNKVLDALLRMEL